MSATITLSIQSYTKVEARTGLPTELTRESANPSDWGYVSIDIDATNLMVSCGMDAVDKLRSINVAIGQLVSELDDLRALAEEVERGT